MDESESEIEESEDFDRVIFVKKVLPKLSILLLLIKVLIIQLDWSLYMLTLMLDLCRKKERKM